MTLCDVWKMFIVFTKILLKNIFNNTFSVKLEMEKKQEGNVTSKNCLNLGIRLLMILGT
jgi:5-methylcytosine-specific restriction endonuclease McrBC regulatory subunit McrC